MATKAPKPPKKPKQNAPLTSWERYDAKMKLHHAKVKAIEDAKKKKAAIMKKHNGNGY